MLPIFLAFTKKGRAFMKNNPFITFLLTIIAVALVMGAVDLWRTYSTPATADCGRWKVTFKRGIIPVFEWPALVSWLHGKVAFNITNNDTISVEMDKALYEKLKTHADARGWKYEGVPLCAK